MKKTSNTSRTKSSHQTNANQLAASTEVFLCSTAKDRDGDGDGEKDSWHIKGMESDSSSLMTLAIRKFHTAAATSTTLLGPTRYLGRLILGLHGLSNSGFSIRRVSVSWNFPLFLNWKRKKSYGRNLRWTQRLGLNFKRLLSLDDRSYSVWFRLRSVLRRHFAC